MSVFVFKWYYSRISVLSLAPIYGESGRMILVNLVQSRRRLIFLYHSVCFYEFSRLYLPSLHHEWKLPDPHAGHVWAVNLSYGSLRNQQRKCCHSQPPSPARAPWNCQNQQWLKPWNRCRTSQPNFSTNVPMAKASRIREGKHISCLHHRHLSLLN